MIKSPNTARQTFSKGQTLFEFLLVFLVLFAATNGVLLLYKKMWTSKYNRVKAVSERAATTSEGIKLKTLDGYSEYVK